jgi:hypothetical protein
MPEYYAHSDFRQGNPNSKDLRPSRDHLTEYTNVASDRTGLPGCWLA